MDWTRRKIKKKCLFLLIVIVCFVNCTNRDNSKQWDEARIDPQIVQDSVYQNTSNVIYLIEQKKDSTENQHLRLNNCRAYYLNSNILFINIGTWNGSNGQGIVINFLDRKFYTETYFDSDLIIEGLKESKQKIVFQKLTLDKPEYNLGDSLYGKMEFKSIEISNKGDSIIHYGKGSFRTKVTKT